MKSAVIIVAALAIFCLARVADASPLRGAVCANGKCGAGLYVVTQVAPAAPAPAAACTATVKTQAACTSTAKTKVVRTPRAACSGASTQVACSGTRAGFHPLANVSAKRAAKGCS